MAGQSALRRWKPFFETFSHVDAAIEAADPALSRDKFRRVRGDIVVLLCDAAGDDAKAEEICVMQDGVMAESLVTLQSVPADAVPRILASSADLTNAVAALRGHESERVRRLARDVVRRWRASVEDDFVGFSADMEKMDALSQLLPPKSRASHVSDGRTNNVSSNHGAKKNHESKPCLKNGKYKTKDTFSRKHLRSRSFCFKIRAKKRMNGWILS